MKHKAAVILKYGGLCILCLVVLFGVYLASAVLDGKTVATATQTALHFYDPPVTCSFPDQSFCKTEQMFRKFVAANDASDILANQEDISLMLNYRSATALCRKYGRTDRPGL